MKDTDYENIIEVVNVANGFVPYNEKAVELNEQTKSNDMLCFKEITPRDINFHRAWFSLLNFIYDYLPKEFTNVVSSGKFYLWLKHLKGQYKVLYSFQDGTKMVQYESISFSNMTDPRFKEYIKEQLPYIYENVIGKFFKGTQYDDIIETIEQEYMKFLIKL